MRSCWSPPGDVSSVPSWAGFMLAPSAMCPATTAKHILQGVYGGTCACDLMRPAMYGAYHHITVMGKETAPATTNTTW